MTGPPDGARLPQHRRHQEHREHLLAYTDPTAEPAARTRLARALGQEPLHLFLTVGEIAVVMRTDPRTVRRGIEAGDIPAVRVNSAVRVPTDAFINQVLLDPPAVQLLDDTAPTSTNSETLPASPVAAPINALRKSSGGSQHAPDPAA